MSTDFIFSLYDVSIVILVIDSLLAFSLCLGCVSLQIVVFKLSNFLQLIKLLFTERAALVFSRVGRIK